MKEAPTAIRLTQVGRAFIALLIPLPFLLFRYVWHSVNAFYNPETYNPLRFWLASIPELVIAIAIGLFVGVWRFRSQRVGNIMLCIGAMILASSTLMIWLALG